MLIQYIIDEPPKNTSNGRGNWILHLKDKQSLKTKYWLDKGWKFPEISNCRFCFHHRDIEQQRQAELEPDNLQWWLEQEEKTGHTFGKRPLKNILAQPLLDVYGDREPCHCTD